MPTNPGDILHQVQTGEVADPNTSTLFSSFFSYEATCLRQV